MRKLLLAVATWAALFAPAFAANVNIDALPAASSAGGTDLLECEQGGTNRKCTAAQVAAYVYGLMSGDATTNGTGTITLATVNGNVGTFGSATQCITTTQNAKGLTTAISAATCTPAVGSITGFGTGVAAALAATLNSSTGMVGALTPTNGNCIVGNGTAWTSATCATGTATAVPSVQSGTNYAFQGTDLTKVIYLSNASPQVPTIAQAGTGSFTSGWYTTACNIGAGTQTITPTTSTIAGASTYVLPAGSIAAPKCIGLVSDGTNYVIVPDYFRWGTGVETAAGLALSAAGGLTTTVASGSLALATSAITSGSCTSAQTATATGAATTDRITWTPNADITAVTGYAPVTTGGLAIYPYATTNTVNFKVCNPTSSSITPGAVTLNWAIHR